MKLRYRKLGVEAGLWERWQRARRLRKLVAGKPGGELFGLMFSFDESSGAIRSAAWREWSRRARDLGDPETIAHWERRTREAHSVCQPLTISWCAPWFLIDDSVTIGPHYRLSERPGEGWRGLVRRQDFVIWRRHARLHWPWAEARRAWREFEKTQRRDHPDAYRAQRRRVWHARLHPPWRYLLPYAWAELRWRLAGREEWPKKASGQPPLYSLPAR